MPHESIIFCLSDNPHTHQHCQIIPDDLGVEETVHPSSITKISAQAFTPILGTFLLSPSAKVGGTARFAVVDMLCRIKKIDRREVRSRGIVAPTPSSHGSGTESDSDEEAEIVVGLFGPEERAMFKHELLHQVVIGIGRLDVDGSQEDTEVRLSRANSWIVTTRQQEYGHAVEVVTPGEGTDEEGVSTPDPRRDSEMSEETPGKPTAGAEINPYFPVLSTPYFVPSPASSNASTPSTDTTNSSISSSSPFNTPPVVGNTPPEETSIFSSVEAQGSTSKASASQETASHEWTSRSTSASSPALPSPLPSPSGQVPSNPIPGASSRSIFSVGDSDSGHSSGMDDEEDGQASVGRLASMSLIAAVTARGKYFR